MLGRNMRKPAIIAAIISAVAVVVAALITIYPSLRNQTGNGTGTITSISGIVEEEDTKRVIGQATITVAGRTEQYVTEDSGNFKIDLRSDAPKRLRLHVSKSGFQSYDASVEAPAENMVILLRKQ
jgi:hypothetical protein